jgi:hypothetical protein
MPKYGKSGKRMSYSKGGGKKSSTGIGRSNKRRMGRTGTKSK